MSRKQWLQYIFTLILSLAVLLAARQYVQQRSVYDYTQADFISMKGRVISIDDVEESELTMSGGQSMTDKTITFSVKLLNEYRAGEVVVLTQVMDPLVSYTTKEVEEGDLVLVNEYHTDAGYNYMFGDYWRSNTLWWLLGLFVLAVLTFGRLKGLNTILGLAVTCLFVFWVFVPAILAGCNIYAWSILACLYSILTTLLIVDGYQRKTFIAASGCFGGVLVAGVLTAVFNRVMNISGVVDEQSMYLNDLSSELTVDLRAIIFAAIIIGATGAVMDVAISIASSLSTVVLIVAYNASPYSIFNKELIATDIAQALIGSLGILSAIPLTSLLAAWIYPRLRRPHKKAAPADVDADADTAPAPAEVPAAPAAPLPDEFL